MRASVTPSQITRNARMKKARILTLKASQQARLEAGVLKFGYSVQPDWPLSGMFAANIKSDPLVLGAAAVASETLVREHDRGYVRAVMRERSKDLGCHVVPSLDHSYSQLVPTHGSQARLLIREAMITEWQLSWDQAARLARTKYWRKEFIRWWELKLENDKVWNQAVNMWKETELLKVKPPLQELRKLAMQKDVSKRNMRTLLEFKLQARKRAESAMRYEPQFVFGGMLEHLHGDQDQDE